MAESLFHGGVAEVIIDDVGGDFVTDPDLTITQFAKEGNKWPNPTVLTDDLADEQAGPTGEEVPFDLRCLNLEADDVSALRTEAHALAPKDVQFTSTDGKTVVVVKGCILGITKSPINDLGKYGVVRVMAKATSAGLVRAYSVIHTP